MKKKGVARHILKFTQDHEFYFRLAVRHVSRRNFSRALHYIDMAIDADPYNADYLFNKACVLVELKKARESNKLLNYIIWNIDPTYSECYFGLGCNYFELGDYDKSLAHFEKYVRMEEDGEFFEDAHEILFYMQITSGTNEPDIGGRIPERNREQERVRTSSMKLHTAGSMYLYRGNYKEAIRQFERSIRVYPEIISSRIRLSMAYYMTGQIELATLLAGSVLKIHKSNRMAKLCLALYYSIDGQVDMSEQILKWCARMRNKKSHNQQETEDHAFYEQMLKTAPVGDDLKNRLANIAQKCMR